jgi:hypothetical protein
MCTTCARLNWATAAPALEVWLHLEPAERGGVNGGADGWAPAGTVLRENGYLRRIICPLSGSSTAGAGSGGDRICRWSDG